MRFLILGLLLPSLVTAQIAFTGTVINKRSRQVVPFVSVGLIQQNVGINADEKGNFALVSKEDKALDTLLVSCVGFTTLKYPVNKNNSKDLIIELEEKSALLKEIFVTNKISWTYAKLNDFNNCGRNFVNSNGFQTQLAQHFQVANENSILTQVTVCCMGFGIATRKKTIFRIRVYDMDSLTKAPSNDLCDQIIEVKTNNRIVSVDLEKYSIHIPKKDFFVAVEWLKIPSNEEKGKVKLKDGSVIERTTYRPSIGWTDNIDPKMEAWMLTYKGYWTPMFNTSNKTHSSISATVKY